MEKRADAISSSWRVFRFVALGVVVTRILLQRIVGLFGSGSRPILPTDLDGRVVDFYPTLATMETRCGFTTGNTGSSSGTAGAVTQPSQDAKGVKGAPGNKSGPAQQPNSSGK